MIVTEFFRKRVKAVERLVCSDPNRAGAVLEQRIDVNPTKAFLAFRIMFEDFEIVTVIAIQAVPGSEPDKPLIVLNHIRNPDLREALGGGYPSKADILTFDDWKPDGFSVHRRIERGAVSAIARSCPGEGPDRDQKQNGQGQCDRRKAATAAFWDAGKRNSVFQVGLCRIVHIPTPRPSLALLRMGQELLIR